MNKNVKRAFAALGVALGIADVKTVGMELETASGETLELKRRAASRVWVTRLYRPTATTLCRTA